MKKLCVFVVCILFAGLLIGCSLKTSSVNENKSNNQDTAKYSEDDMYSLAETIQDYLVSILGSNGTRITCYPSLADDSVIVFAFLDSVDNSDYSKDELLSILEEYKIKDAFQPLSSSLLDAYELQNVAFDVTDKNGELLYLFINGELKVTYGDDPTDLDTSITTIKTRP